MGYVCVRLTTGSCEVPDGAVVSLLCIWHGWVCVWYGVAHGVAVTVVLHDGSPILSMVYVSLYDVAGALSASAGVFIGSPGGAGGCTLCAAHVLLRLGSILVVLTGSVLLLVFTGLVVLVFGFGNTFGSLAELARFLVVAEVVIVVVVVVFVVWNTVEFLADVVKLLVAAGFVTLAGVLVRLGSKVVVVSDAVVLLGAEGCCVSALWGLPYGQLVLSMSNLLILEEKLVNALGRLVFT
jgi:hypothetical protein